MNSNIIDNLHENGYMAEFHDGHAQIIGSRHDYYVTDYATDQRQYMRDPTVSVAVLEFEAEEASPLAAKFIAELLKLVAPADRMFRKHVRPLVRTTANTLQAVYQTDTHIVGLYDDALPSHPQIFQHGFAFPDANRFSTGNLRAACGNVRLDGGVWLENRTPLTVKREALPTWNSQDMAPKLRVLVDRFVTAGELREREPYRAPRRESRLDQR